MEGAGFRAKCFQGLGFRVLGPQGQGIRTADFGLESFLARSRVLGSEFWVEAG